MWTKILSLTPLSLNPDFCCLFSLISFHSCEGSYPKCQVNCGKVLRTENKHAEGEKAKRERCTRETFGLPSKWNNFSRYTFLTHAILQMLLTLTQYNYFVGENSIKTVSNTRNIMYIKINIWNVLLSL